MPLDLFLPLCHQKKFVFNCLTISNRADREFQCHFIDGIYEQ